MVRQGNLGSVLHGMLPCVEHILVVRAGAIGDGLLTLPALAALRTRWPAARVTLLGPRSLLPYVRAAGLVDVALPVEDAAGRALFEDDSSQAPTWAAADLAVVWLKQWAAVAGRLHQWGANRIVGSPSQPPVDARIHVADYLFRILRPLGIGRARACHLNLVPADAEEQAARWWWERIGSGAPPAVAIHPGSGSAIKRWPMGRYVELTGLLTRGGHVVLVLLGSAESNMLADWQRVANRARSFHLLTDLELPVVAGLLTRCAAYIGNDSGVSHLSAALGVPTIAIFGPTNPVRWSPIGPNVRVLRDPAWRVDGTADQEVTWSLRPEQVAAACLRLLSARDRRPGRRDAC